MRLWIAQLPNGQYLATCCDVPGLVAQGRTESEAVTIARRWPGSWTTPATWHVCTDPSHPPLFQFPQQQETLHRQLLDEAEALAGSRPPDRQPADVLPGEVDELLRRPADSVQEGYRVQGIRRRVADEWGSVLCRLENLAYVATWFVNGQLDNRNDGHLRFVLCLLALEATRTVFATVHLLRGAMATETFGQWRTLYETFVYSRFLLRFSEDDPDLPGRFSRSTNSMYLDFWQRFGPSGDEHEIESSWTEAEEFYSRYRIEGKGSYDWAHPSIPSRRPTFRDLANAVDGGSEFLETCYQFATSKTHGRFILGFDGIRPTRIGSLGEDPFSTAGIGSVLEFTMPLFRTVVENAIAPTPTVEHERVLDIFRTAIGQLIDETASMRSADPER